MKHYASQEPLISIKVTSDELIALEWVITQYLNQATQTPVKTGEQFELIALLRRFQGRFIPASRLPVTPPLSSREG